MTCTEIFRMLYLQQVNKEFDNKLFLKLTKNAPKQCQALKLKRKGITHHGSTYIKLKCLPTYSQGDRNQVHKFVPQLQCFIQSSTLWEITSDVHYLNYSHSNMKQDIHQSTLTNLTLTVLYHTQTFKRYISMKF